MKKIWNSLTGGLKEFCAKNGFSKVCLGLSGGLDSAICAVLAADALGGENVQALMMKTKHTSDLSLKIAREIAKRNNLSFKELDINSLIDEETLFLTQAFGQAPKQIVLANLQARARGNI